MKPIPLTIVDAEREGIPVADAEQGWKQALFDYVNAVNEAGLGGDPEPLRRIADEAHRARLGRAIRAAARRQAEGALRPVRSEIRTRILRHSRVGSEAIADVELHHVRTYGESGSAWSEERRERERIRLVQAAGGWRVDRVVPMATERPAAVWTGWGAEVTSAEDPFGKIPNLPSIPYLNPAVYAGSGPGGSVRRGIPYRREAAVAYADLWWERPNPAYETFEVNCTNYVSQCLFAGGAPMNYTGRRESGWWYQGRVNGQERWSYSWAVAHSLQQYLSRPRAFGLRAEQVHDPYLLTLGDVICYDWDGNGRFQHNTIVTAFAPDGTPLVNANTVSSRHRFWDYRDSYAFTGQTRYVFFHIADEF